MRSYLIRRLLLIIPTLFILTVLVFLAVRFAEGLRRRKPRALDDLPSDRKGERLAKRDGDGAGPGKCTDE